MAVSRRQFLIGSLVGSAGLVLWPNLAFASAAQAGNDNRFVFVLLRGGLDGLHAVPPWGDPGYARIRGRHALSPSGKRAALRLDDTFALHPSFRYAFELYQQGQFAPVVAAAPPYWGRSHFQAQACVENGTGTPSGAATGWLNRCAAALRAGDALSCAASMPLAMRGPGTVASWSLPLPPPLDPDLLRAVTDAYGQDTVLRAVFQRSVAQHENSVLPRSLQELIRERNAIPGWQTRHSLPVPLDGGMPEMLAGLPIMLGAAAAFMTAPNGPRVAFVENDGWDTHAREAAVLDDKIHELDEGLRTFRERMAGLWDRTVVVIATEFGRTARVNGNGGTDHGTGGAMFLAGGAIRGGRVLGAWPGVGKGALFEDRDLHATTDYRSVFKGVLAGHLGVPGNVLEAQVFPHSEKIQRMEGLLLKSVG